MSLTCHIAYVLLHDDICAQKHVMIASTVVKSWRIGLRSRYCKIEIIVPFKSNSDNGSLGKNIISFQKICDPSEKSIKANPTLIRQKINSVIFLVCHLVQFIVNQKKSISFKSVLFLRFFKCDSFTC